MSLWWLAALKELESITKEKKESSLIVSIITGKKLGMYYVTVS